MSRYYGSLWWTSVQMWDTGFLKCVVWNIWKHKLSKKVGATSEFWASEGDEADSICRNRKYWATPDRAKSPRPVFVHPCCMSNITMSLTAPLRKLHISWLLSPNQPSVHLNRPTDCGVLYTLEDFKLWTFFYKNILFFKDVLAFNTRLFFVRFYTIFYYVLWHLITHTNIYIFEKVEEFKYLGTTLTNQKFYFQRNQEQIEVRKCLLSFGAESFVFQVAIQKFKD